MTWTEMWKVTALVITSLGGGGAIVFGLSGVLGNIWVQRLKGDIDAKLQRLEAALEHRNFVLQRFAELELEGIVECWRAARACLPLLNATRPDDSGTSESDLAARTSLLSDAHNELVRAVGRHEPFLPADLIPTLGTIGQVVRLELSNIKHHEHFAEGWWEGGAKNREQLGGLIGALLFQVRVRAAALRKEEGDRS